MAKIDTNSKNHLFNDDDDEQELNELRLAALKSIGKKVETTLSSTSSTSSTKQFNSNSPSRHDADYRRTNYARNGCIRSNLIVLTAADVDIKNPSKRSSCATNDCNQVPHTLTKQRVLPGRFSRFEREDSDDDESDDDLDDDNNEHNDEETDSSACEKIVYNSLSESENTHDSNCEREKLIDPCLKEETITNNNNDCTQNCVDLNACKNDSNLNNNEIIIYDDDNKCNDINACLSANKTANNIIKCETKNETIKLNPSTSGVDVIERRRQKFGSTHTNVDPTLTDFHNHESVSSYNALNHAQKRKSSRNNSRKQNSRSNINQGPGHTKELRISLIGKCKRITREMNDHDSNEFEECNKNHGRRKKLRSLVVMKNE